MSAFHPSPAPAKSLIETPEGRCGATGQAIRFARVPALQEIARGGGSGGWSNRPDELDDIGRLRKPSALDPAR